MKEEECVKVIMDTPDYVMSVFWIFLTTLMLAIILVIIFGGLGALIDWYQERRRDYLRNKQMKIELERMEKQYNGKI